MFAFVQTSKPNHEPHGWLMPSVIVLSLAWLSGQTKAGLKGKMQAQGNIMGAFWEGAENPGVPLLRSLWTDVPRGERDNCRNREEPQASGYSKKKRRDGLLSQRDPSMVLFQDEVSLPRQCFQE